VSVILSDRRTCARHRQEEHRVGQGGGADGSDAEGAQNSRSHMAFGAAVERVSTLREKGDLLALL